MIISSEVGGLAAFQRRKRTTPVTSRKDEEAKSTQWSCLGLIIVALLLLLGLERKLQISNRNAISACSVSQTEIAKTEKSDGVNAQTLAKKTFYTSLPTKIVIEEVWRGHFCHNIRFQEMLQLSISTKVGWCISLGLSEQETFCISKYNFLEI